MCAVLPAAVLQSPGAGVLQHGHAAIVASVPPVWQLAVLPLQWTLQQTRQHSAAILTSIL